MYLPDEYFLLLMATLVRSLEVSNKVASQRDEALEMAQALLSQRDEARQQHMDFLATLENAMRMKPDG